MMKKLIAILLCVLILSTLTLAVFADNGSTVTPDNVPSPTSETVAPTPTNPHEDNTPTSPATGANVMLYVVVLVVGLFGAVLSVKKLAKNQ